MLSDTQQAILDFIGRRIDEDGMPPSQVEIAAALGFRGVRAAQYHLEILEQAGKIERLPGRARAATRASDDAALHLPVLGRVAAGTPIGNDALDADNVVLIDRSFFFPVPDYLLKVKGDSMRDDGIFDGDLIGVHRTAQARSGDIVIARVDEEITVKRLKVGKDGIRLLPRNPDYAPIEVRPDQDFAIEGLYCGLVRPSR